MRALLYQWIKTNRVMLVNAGSLIGTTMVTGILGFAYWWVADRQFQPAVVGLASASVSAMMLLGPMCVLGLGTLLIGELPRQPGKEASLISTALILVGAVGGLVGMLFALIAPFTSVDFLPLRANIGTVLIFASGVSLASITIVLDQALIGLLHGQLQFWRNTIFAALKLVILLALALWLHSYIGGVAIYATWAMGSFISLVPLAALVLIKNRSMLRHALPDWSLLRKLGASALQHHMLNLILQVPTTSLPVLVTILLSATTNAWFYTAWMISGLVFIASYALTTVLYAINSAQAGELARKIRMTLGLSFITCLGANVVLQVGANVILGLFGHVYAEQASWSLRILALAAFPVIVKYHYIAIKRIDERLARAMLPVACGSVLELGAATLGAHLGALLGLSIGWVVAVYVEGLFMTPTVYKAAHFNFSKKVVEQNTPPQLTSVAASNGVEHEDTRQLASVSATNGIEKEDTRQVASVATIDAVEEEDTRQVASVVATSAVEEEDTRQLASIAASGAGAVEEKEGSWRFISGEMTAVQQMLSISSPIPGEQRPPASNGTKQAQVQRLPKLPTAIADEETKPVLSTSAANTSELDDTQRLPIVAARSARRQYCPRCHTLLAINASFCRNCGIELDASKVAKNKSRPIYIGVKAGKELRSAHDVACSQCDTLLPSYANFCSACGKNIEQIDKERSLAARLGALASVVLPLLALVLWALSLQAVHLDLKNMNNLGLVSIFPPTFISALFILSISFCLALWQKRLNVSVFLFHLLLLIFMLYAITALVEDVPRFAVVYRHAGYTDYILRHGSVDPGLDAYFNWPGFFIYSAFLTKIAGYQSILPYAAWAPVFFNLLYLGPLYMIATSATTDKRIVWLSLWFFYVTNWIAQDYISPQGLNYFFYLVMIAILVKWFKVPRPGRPLVLGQRWRRLGHLLPLAQSILDWATAPDMLSTPIGRRQRIILQVCLVAIFGMIVFSHPLTPFLAIATITALVVLRRCKPIWLPAVMIFMTAGWLYFMAQPYLSGNINALLGDFTHLGASITQNVTGRVTQGDAQHNLISNIRLLMTAVIWGLAFVGAVLRMRKGYRDVTYVVLAVAPFPVFLAQSYGGEMLLRIYLFTLPAMTLFAASIFYIPSIRKASFWMKGAVVFTCIVLIGSFLFTRYGNERMDYMTSDELAGVQHLYSIAPHGSYLLELWNGTAWEFENYELYRHDSLGEDIPAAVLHKDVNAVIGLIHKQPTSSAYIIITRSQRATADSEGLPRGTLDQLVQKLLASKKFARVYANHDAQILFYIGGK